MTSFMRNAQKLTKEDKQTVKGRERVNKEGRSSNTFSLVNPVHAFPKPRDDSLPFYKMYYIADLPFRTERRKNSMREERGGKHKPALTPVS